jgi:cytochrome c oxidase cbb3-type subunit IV
MKFINYLEGITGIGIYPLTSFLIFFIFFSAVTIYILKAGKKTFEHASNIPLDNYENRNN